MVTKKIKAGGALLVAAAISAGIAVSGPPKSVCKTRDRAGKVVELGKLSEQDCMRAAAAVTRPKP